jgi:hypothetical protein
LGVNLSKINTRCFVETPGVYLRQIYAAQGLPAFLKNVGNLDYTLMKLLWVQDYKSCIALLKTRFGELDEQLMAIAPKLLALPPEEYSRLLLELAQRSRQDLLDQFS